MMKNSLKISIIIMLFGFIINPVFSKVFLKSYEKYFIIETFFENLENMNKFKPKMDKLKSILFSNVYIELPVKVQDYRYVRTMFYPKDYFKIIPLDYHLIQVNKIYRKTINKIVSQYRKRKRFVINNFLDFSDYDFISKLSEHNWKDKIYKVRFYLNFDKYLASIQVYKLLRYGKGSINKLYKKEKNWISIYEKNDIDLNELKIDELVSKYNSVLEYKMAEAFRSKEKIEKTWELLSTLFFQGGLDKKKESELEFKKENHSFIFVMKKLILESLLRV